MDELELMAFIIGRGRGDELIKLAYSENISFSLILHGRGTVNSEILNSLGLDGPEKDVVLLSVDKQRADEKLLGISRKLKLDKPGNGIAFTMPFSAAASQYMSYELFAGRMPEKKTAGSIKRIVKSIKKERIGKKTESGGLIMRAADYDLIVTIVNRGFADDVMLAARKAGAFGGTIVNARGTGMNDQKKFFGSVIEPEKEMVLILTDHASRNAIMEEITGSVGLSRAGAGICFSLPTDSVAGLSREHIEEK